MVSYPPSTQRTWPIGLLAALSLFTVAISPAQAQSGAIEQASRVAEALKQAALKSPKQPGYYSDWQVKGDRVPLWSRQCLGREMTPAQFEENPTNATSIVVCIVKDMMRQEIRSARNDEAGAVKRVAAWWVTGDPNRANAKDIAPYAQQVLALYQSGSTSIAAQPPIGQPITPAPEIPIDLLPKPKIEPVKPKIEATPKPATPKPITPEPTAPTTPGPATPIVIKANGTNFYDRYMQAGYTASKAKNFKRAIIFFRRAMDERPNDAFAGKAIENMEKQLTK
jgi:hypothetical protein